MKAEEIKKIGLIKGDNCIVEYKHNGLVFKVNVYFSQIHNNKIYFEERNWAKDIYILHHKSIISIIKI